MASSIQPLCIHCVSGDVIPGEPKGTIETIGPYETYVSKPPAESASAASEGKAVVLFTDVFGLALQNNKIVADLIAERSSITVYVPDLFNGQAMAPERMTMPTSAKEMQQMSILTKLGTMMTLVPWVYRHWPTSKYPNIEKYLAALKSDKGVQRVGGVGYCYGAKAVVDFNTKGLLDATVVNHPSFTNEASYQSLKAPILMNCAEHDDQMPPKLREQIKKMLDENQNAPAHDVRVYENCAHGFGARPNLAIEEVKKGFEEATDRTASWFKSHL